ncbi:SBBP repeat beta-propeller lipoprotein, LipL53 family [Leptospira barantonii]|nr:SBBP repeat-containing protein [Leptospira barantonii]
MKSFLAIPILLIFLSACNPANHMNPANPGTDEYWIAQILGRIHPLIFRENTGTLEWTELLGKSGGTTLGKHIALDPFLFPIVAGETNTNLFTGSLIGSQDLIVAKYDSFKNRIWSKQLGASGASLTMSRMTTDSAGNSYILGYTNAPFSGPLSSGQDLFIVKISLDGNPLWIKQAGPTGGSYFVNPLGLCVDTAGNVYASGDSNGPFGGAYSASTNTFVIRFDSQGNQVWVKQFFVTGANSNGSSLVCDAASGSVYFTGWGGANFQTETAPGIGGNDMFIFKYDINGNRQFIAYQAESTKEILSGPIATDLSGNIIVGAVSNADFGTGATGVGYFGTILKYNSSGTLLWGRQLGKDVASSSTSVYDLRTDLAGNIFATGITNANLITGGSSSTGTTDAFFAKYNANGDLQWVRQTGVSGGSIQGYGIVIDPEGTMYSVGHTNAAMNGATLNGIQDLFLVKYR